MKMCNTHLARCWKASKLKEVHLYNRHWRARFPAGTIPPHGTGTGAATQRGLSHLPGTRATSPRQNAFAGSVCVATLAQPTPTTRPLCLQFRSFGRKAESIPSLPRRCWARAPHPDREERAWVTAPGWAATGCDGGRQIQGANGTILLSMDMQQSTSSLLPRVYYYYLYLSSI